MNLEKYRFLTKQEQKKISGGIAPLVAVQLGFMLAYAYQGTKYDHRNTNHKRK